MLWHLLNQLTQSVTVFFRTIKAFFSRRIMGVTARIRQMTNLTRGASKIATTSFQSAAAATQKPTKREDYIETGALLVAKSFLLKLVIAIVAAILLCYFFLWPFILSHFLTARFFVEDSRIENWTGRVIVYSDKKKTVPMYEGKLEDGLLENQGKEYDRNGVLSYDGNFLHGERSGQGIAYHNGLISYKGNFEGGVASGNGISYNSDGEMTYQGEFAEGVPEGTGKAYKDGRMIYQGGFSAGKYSGQGTLYPDIGEQIDATFLGGEPDGVVTWSRNGQNYYQGEWDNDRPEGYGTLYSKSGKTIYQGQMTGGTLDGQWLLTLTLDELKEVLGESHTSTAQENSQAFLLIDPELGLMARCSYQTEDEDSQVYSIYLYQPKGEAWVKLLPGMDNVKLSVKGDVTERKTGNLQFNTPKGVDVKPGVYDSEMIFTADDRTTLLRDGAGGPSVVLTWSRLSSPPVNSILSGGGADGAGGAGGGGADGAASAGAAGDAAAEAAMDEFLDALDGMQGASGAESVPNDYCGDTSPAEALRACSAPEQLSALVNAMTDYWLQSELQAGLESNLLRVQGQLDDANAGKIMGSSGNTKALEQQKVTLEGQITSRKNQRAQAQVEAKQAAGIDPAKFAAGSLLTRFDPSSLNVSSLVPTAAAYAQATGKEADPAALELEIKTLLVEMKDSYDRIQSSADAYKLAAEQSQSAATSFAMGQTDKAAWFSALSGEVDAKLTLFTATAEFTKQANSLNALTGGWVSRNCGWFSQEMGSIYEKAMKETSKDESSTESNAVVTDATKSEGS